MDKSSIIFNMQFVATEYASKNIQKKVGKTVNTKEQHDYYDRDEACDKTRSEEIEDAFNYYNYRIGSTGCFNKNGFVEEDDYYKKIEKYKPQIMYRGVISFRNEFALENDIKNPEAMRNLIKKTMEKNIKILGFDPNNVEWFAFYHTNTNSPHVHFHFYEKEPKKRVYLISKERLRKFKSTIVRYMKLNTEVYVDRDKLKNQIYRTARDMKLSQKAVLTINMSENNSKSYFQNDKKIIDEFIRLERIIPRTGSMKYNSYNIAPYKKNVDALIDLILQTDQVNTMMNEYVDQLKKEKEMQEILYGSSSNNLFFENQIKSVKDKIGNMILQSIKKFREDAAKYDELVKDSKNPDRHRKYSSQRKAKHISHNIRTRSVNFISGVSREICMDLRKSHYATMQMRRKAEEAFYRAQEENIRTRGQSR